MAVDENRMVRFVLISVVVGVVIMTMDGTTMEGGWLGWG